MPTIASLFFCLRAMVFKPIMALIFVGQRLITLLAKMCSHCRIGFIKNFIIRIFITCFDIKVNEAKQTNPFAYPSFDAFFTRELQATARTIDANPLALISPVDGRIVDGGAMTSQQQLIAKYHHYDPKALLANDDELIAAFTEAHYLTFYLAPHNYHRIHMPITGQLKKTIYVPGWLRSVQPKVVAKNPDLYAKNERLICFFETEHGPMGIILIGAFLVGSISTVWGRRYQPLWSLKPSTEDFNADNITLEKGQELGMFHYGSSVIVLYPSAFKNTIHQDLSLQPCQLGEALAFATVESCQ